MYICKRYLRRCNGTNTLIMPGVMTPKNKKKNPDHMSKMN